jgi:hypothetical protein
MKEEIVCVKNHEALGCEATFTGASRSLPVANHWVERKGNILPKWKFCSDLNNTAWIALCGKF